MTDPKEKKVAKDFFGSPMKKEMNKRDSHGYIVRQREESTKAPMDRVADFRPSNEPTTIYNHLTPRQKAASDATRAVPAPRIPTVTEKLREAYATKDEPSSKVARGSRQVEANRLADEVRKSRK